MADGALTCALDAAEAAMVSSPMQLVAADEAEVEL
jgi:hypothetical protein